ncbi:MAG: insulinase family protein [Proteobacteria bacterium]|nr:insulinase family protein [Pseudomonadota bacterium]
MKFSQTKLANGLTIIGEQRLSAVSSALAFFVKTGARDETAGISGVSHFLEHMMFKGTETRTALDINFQLSAIGAQANAYTSEENTVYYAAVLPEYFAQAMELFSDMLRPKLAQDDFDVEKKVILEEIALYHDKPNHVIFEAALKEHFKNHSAGNSVLGTIQSITDLTSQQMKDYFNLRYSPNNIVLAASGNFDWDEFVAMAEKYCGSWKTTPTERKIVADVPTFSKLSLKKENMQRAHLCYLAKGPSTTDEERYSADILSIMLGDGSNSKIFWELIDKGLADSAAIDTEQMDGTGVVIGYASCPPENVEKVGDILRRIMTDSLNFTKADMDLAVTKLATRVVLQAESSMRRLMSIGLDWTYSNEYLPPEKELELIKAVTPESIKKLIEKYPFTPVTEVHLLPA